MAGPAKLDQLDHMSLSLSWLLASDALESLTSSSHPRPDSLEKHRVLRIFLHLQDLVVQGASLSKCKHKWGQCLPSCAINVLGQATTVIAEAGAGCTGPIKGPVIRLLSMTHM